MTTGAALVASIPAFPPTRSSKRADAHLHHVRHALDQWAPLLRSDGPGEQL